MSELPSEPRPGLASFVESRRDGLRSNAEVFRRLAARAESRERVGAWAEAAAWAQAAANFASRNHTGLFASAPVERLLARIGRAATNRSARGSGSAVGSRHGGRRRVLHIVTETYPVGGHTRLLERWMRIDSESRHSLAVTQQGRAALSREVSAACQASGGSLHLLRESARRGLAEDALLVRSLAEQADFVVSHAHPYDVVPALAVASRAAPASIMLNHADHVFLAGTSAFDAIACLRDSGAALCRERRGLSGARLALLPIPLDLPTVARTREKAKADLTAELGLEAGTTLVLTVAQPYKYAPAGGIDLLAAIAGVLASRRSIALVAVGPEESGGWAEAAKRACGRVRALGVRRDVDRFYAAADVYLDSAPFASLTSLLEAGMHGVPVVSYQPVAEARVLCSDDRGLRGVHVVARTAAELERDLCSLLDDRSMRENLGERTRESIMSTHSPTIWRARLEELYMRASELRLVRDDSLADGWDVPRCESVDALLYELHRVSGKNMKLARVLKRASRQMPLLPRLTLEAKVGLLGPDRSF